VNEWQVSGMGSERIDVNKQSIKSAEQQAGELRQEQQ